MAASVCSCDKSPGPPEIALVNPSSTADPPVPIRRHLLRSRGDDGYGKVTNIELFFDLVFVYAVTQLSHTLLHGLNSREIGRASCRERV